jgi:hypothetical protein
MKTKLPALFALMMIVAGVIVCAGATGAYAAAGDPTQDGLAPDEAVPAVKEVWLTGDMLHINVAENGAGGDRTLEINLRDYAKPADEYVTVQATDSGGKTSNPVTFKNPYYEPTAATDAAVPADTGESAAEDATMPEGGGNPLTPDGTGTVLDNATDGDGKEFFTAETPDGNVFYIIVDRERESDNVYLLNSVNEDDLASLAKPGDGKPVSAVPTQEPPPTAEQPAEPTPTPEPEPEKGGAGNTGTIAFIVITAVLFGGAAYYFKIVRPKKDGASDSGYDDSDDFDDDENLDLDREEDEAE